MVNRIAVIMLMSLATAVGTHAQTVRGVQRADSLVSLADSLLASRYRRTKTYDTLYIQRPAQRWTFKVRGNMSSSAFTAGGRRDETDFRGHLEADLRGTISLAASYQGLGVGFAINPMKLAKRASQDMEFNLNVYNNRWGVDASFSYAKTYSGTIRTGDERYEIAKGTVNMKMLTVNAYYVFNYRRFSIPAAFTQSYIQRRSAGSWLASVSYQGGRVKAEGTGVPGSDNVRMYLGHFAVGGGYGYNLVTRHRWLFHASFLPTLVVVNRDNIEIEGVKQKEAFTFPDFILTERASIVHQFRSGNFAGASLVMNNTLFGRPNRLFMTYHKWMLRLTFGVRL